MRAGTSWASARVLDDLGHWARLAGSIDAAGSPRLLPSDSPGHFSWLNQPRSSVYACFGRFRATASAAFVSAFFVLAVSVVAVFGQSRAKRGPKAGLSRATAMLQKPRFESAWSPDWSWS